MGIWGLDRAQFWGAQAVLPGALPSSGVDEKADICLQASLKNVLFSAGPNALFDRGQNIYGCWASYFVWLHSPPSKAGLGPQPQGDQ